MHWSPDLVRFCETKDEALKVKSNFMNHVLKTAINSDINMFNNNRREENSKYIWASGKVKIARKKTLLPIS